MLCHSLWDHLRLCPGATWHRLTNEVLTFRWSKACLVRTKAVQHAVLPSVGAFLGSASSACGYNSPAAYGSNCGHTMGCQVAASTVAAAGTYSTWITATAAAAAAASRAYPQRQQQQHTYGYQPSSPACHWHTTAAEQRQPRGAVGTLGGHTAVAGCAWWRLIAAGKEFQRGG